MEKWGIMLVVAGIFLLLLIIVNWTLTRKKKPKKDTRTQREKALDKIAEIKGTK